MRAFLTIYKLFREDISNKLLQNAVGEWIGKWRSCHGSREPLGEWGVGGRLRAGRAVLGLIWRRRWRRRRCLGSYGGGGGGGGGAWGHMEEQEEEKEEDVGKILVTVSE